MKYYVIGQGPVMVFRDEDYQRNINMEDGPTLPEAAAPEVDQEELGQSDAVRFSATTNAVGERRNKASRASVLIAHAPTEGAGPSGCGFPCRPGLISASGEAELVLHRPMSWSFSSTDARSCRSSARSRRW